MEPSSLVGGGAGAAEKVAQDCDKGPAVRGTTTDGLVKQRLVLGTPLCFSHSQLVMHTRILGA